MSVTSLQRTDRTAERDALSATVSRGSRVSSSPRAELGRAATAARRAARRRDVLPGAPRRERGLTTESSR